MNSTFIKFVQIWQYRFGILGPKNNNLTILKRNVHWLLIERIVPYTITFCQTVEKPFGIKLAEIITGAVASTIIPESFFIVILSNIIVY